MTNTPISSIRNLGPAMEEAFIKAGVRDAETLREIGPDAAYKKLLETGHRPQFIAYYAMVMGLQGRPWNDLTGSEKSDLRRRFDDIKSSLTKTQKDHSEIEMILDKIGVRNPT